MKSRTITHTAAFEINQRTEELFALFSPEGERLWVPGWDYENLMDSTGLHDDYVFRTKNHDHAGSEAIWIVKKYEPDIYRVQYYKIEPGEKVGAICVHCHPLEKESTRVEVTYTYIGLSDSGNRFIGSFDRPAYEEFIGEWQTLLKAHFEKTSGDTLPPHR